MIQEAPKSIPFKARTRLLGKMLQDTVLHPKTNSVLIYDQEHETFRVKHLSKEEARRREEARELLPGVPITLRLKVVGAFFKEAVFHPRSTSTISVDTDNKKVIVKRR